MADDKIQIEIALKGAKEAVASLEKIAKEGTTAAKKTENGFVSFFKNMQVGTLAIVAIATKAFTTIKNTIGKSIEDAANKAEELQKFNVVFRGVEKGAMDMVKVFAREFRLADSTVVKMYGSLGDLLTGFGFTSAESLKLSDRIARLGTDLAAFNNFSEGAEGASRRLLSALTGETEGLKALGIVVRQDTKEFEDQVKKIAAAENISLQQAKAIAILNEAYRQSPNAIGAAGREIESFASQSRELNENVKQVSESFGEILLPVIGKALISINKFFKSLKEGGLSEAEIQKEQLGLSKEFENRIGKMSESYNYLTKEKSDYIKKTDEEIKKNKEKITQNNLEIEKLKTLEYRYGSTKESRTEINRLTGENTRLAKENETANSKIAGVLSGQEIQVKKTTVAIKDQNDSIEKNIEDSAEWLDMQEVLRKGNEDTTKTVDTLALSTKGLSGVFSAIGGADGAFASAILATAETARELEDLSLKADQAAVAGERLAKSWNQVANVINIVKTALNFLSDGFRDWGEFIEENAREGSAFQKFGIFLQDTSKILDVMASGSIPKIIQGFKDIKALIEGEDSETFGEADGKDRGLTQTGSEGAVSAAEGTKKRKDIAAAVATTGMLLGPVAGAIAGGVASRRRALGGPVTAGNPYMVGERGPEMLIPNASGRIVPNNSVTNSRSVNINGPITVKANNPQEFIDALNRYQRANGVLA